MPGKTKPGRSAMAGGIKATKVANASPTRLKRLISIHSSLTRKGICAGSWFLKIPPEFHPNLPVAARRSVDHRAPGYPSLYLYLEVQPMHGAAPEAQPTEPGGVVAVRTGPSSPPCASRRR